MRPIAHPYRYITPITQSNCFPTYYHQGKLKAFFHVLPVNLVRQRSKAHKRLPKLLWKRRGKE